MPGRKKYQPTEKERGQVQLMAAAGTQGELIARVVGIDKKTLYKYFRDEIDLGHIRANTTVVSSLYRAATAAPGTPGQVAAAIFWCKARMGWKEVHNLEHSGPGGAAIEFTFSLDHASAKDD